MTLTIAVRQGVSDDFPHKKDTAGRTDCGEWDKATNHDDFVIDSDYCPVEEMASNLDLTKLIGYHDRSGSCVPHDRQC